MTVSKFNGLLAAVALAGSTTCAGAALAQGRDVLMQAVTASGKGYIVAVNTATGAVRDIEIGKSASTGPISRRTNQAYFSDYDGGQVAILDTTLGGDFTTFGKVKKTVAVGKQPWTVTPIPGQEKFLVSNEGDATISVLDGDTGTVTQTIKTCSTPRWVEPSNDGRRFLVSCFGSGTLGIIDAATLTMTGEIAVGKGPEALLTLGNYLLVANQTGKDIAIVDLTTDKVVKTLPMSITPSRFRVTNAGPKPTVLVLANGTGDTKLAYVQIDQLAITDSLVVGEVDVAGTSRQVAVSPNREKAYVAVSETGTIVVLDNLKTGITKTIAVGGTPRSIVAGNDGFLYAASRGNALVSVIDPETDTVIKTYPMAGRTVANTTTLSPMPASGIWQDPAQPGTAYAIQIAGRNIHLGAFTYRADGSPVWYVSGGRLSALAEGKADPVLDFSGSLAEFRNGPTLGSGNTTAAWAGDIARIRLTAGTANEIAVELTTAAGSTRQTLKRYDIIPNGNLTGADLTNQAALWTWAQNEPGAGYFSEMQGRSTFSIYAMYDAAGRATWYYGLAEARDSLSLTQSLMQASRAGQGAGTATQVGTIAMAHGQNGSFLTLPGRTLRITGFRF